MKLACRRDRGSRGGYAPGMRRLPALLASSALLSLGASPGCAGKFYEEEGDQRVERVEMRKGESQAEALHRRGVHCMEELERPECAIEHFEELIELDPRERELVGDALFRLIQLYDRKGDEEATHRLVRKFWSLGTGHRNRSTAPYSAQFLGRDMTTAVYFSSTKVQAAPFWASTDPELQEWLMTCDEDRRKEIEETRAERKRAERAAGGQSDDVARPEGTVPADDPNAKGDENKDEKKGDEEDERLPPIYSEIDFCDFLGVLGMKDQRELDSWFLASNHFQQEKSAFVLVVDDAKAALQFGLTAGTLEAAGDRRYRWIDQAYDDGGVFLVQLDSDEVMVLPEAMVEPVMGAYTAREDNLNRDLDELLGRVPEDSAFATLVTRAALEEAFREVPTWARGAVPIPDGFMMAGVAYQYTGLFLRFDTKSPLKTQMLAGVARWLVGRMLENEDGEGDDDLPREVLDNLDIVPSEDGKSVLVSLFMSRGQTVQLIDSIAD